MEAVETLCEIARKIASQREGLLSGLAALYGFLGKRGRLVSLWSTAFIPSTPPAQLKMLQQILLLTDSSPNYLFPIKSIRNHQLNSSLMNKAELLRTLLRSHSSATTGADHALRTGEALYNLTDSRLKQARNVLYLYLFVILVCPLIALAGLVGFLDLF